MKVPVFPGKTNPMTFSPLFAFSLTFPALSLNYLRLTSFPGKAAILVISDSSIQHQLAN